MLVLPALRESIGLPYIVPLFILRFREALHQIGKAGAASWKSPRQILISSVKLRMVMGAIIWLVLVKGLIVACTGVLLVSIAGVIVHHSGNWCAGRRCLSRYLDGGYIPPKAHVWPSYLLTVSMYYYPTAA